MTQIVERRDELTVGQISGGAEDNEGRRGRPDDAVLTLGERILWLVGQTHNAPVGTRLSSMRFSENLTAIPPLIQAIARFFDSIEPRSSLNESAKDFTPAFCRSTIRHLAALAQPYITGSVAGAWRLKMGMDR